MAESKINEIISSIHQLFRSLRKSFDKQPQAGDLSMLQMHTLFFIKQKQNPTMSELSENFGVTLPTTTKLIDRLAKQNYLKRVNDSTDRRIIRLKLTENGLKIMTKMKNKRASQLKKILQRLSDSDIANLKRIINKLLKTQKND